MIEKEKSQERVHFGVIAIAECNRYNVGCIRVDTYAWVLNIVRNIKASKVNFKKPSKIMTQRKAVASPIYRWIDSFYASCKEDDVYLYFVK